MMFKKTKYATLIRNMDELTPNDPHVMQRQSAALPSPSIPDGMFERCVRCRHPLYVNDLKANMYVCQHCGEHLRIGAMQRVELLADEGSFAELNADLVGKNPLDFPDYDKKLEAAKEAAGIPEGIVTGEAKIDGHPCMLCVMDSKFMMGSMGYALGEKFTRAAEHALETGVPLIAFTASGGARMQEGMVSLMQMAKTSGAVMKLNDAGILYIAVITDPTTGGVTASFASLADITLAEPRALIGFAGRRVIEQTMRVNLPENFQRAEFLLEKGFIDKIVPRQELKQALSDILALHAKGGARS